MKKSGLPDVRAFPNMATSIVPLPKWILMRPDQFSKPTGQPIPRPDLHPHPAGPRITLEDECGVKPEMKDELEFEPIQWPNFPRTFCKEL